MSESRAGLTTAEKAEIIADFKEWSGGYTPDECPCESADPGDEDEPTHESYIENALDVKFKSKKAAVKAFLCDFEQ